jgi:hypothetical protein
MRPGGALMPWKHIFPAWRFALTLFTTYVPRASGLPIELARGAVLCFARASAHEMAS